MTRLCDLNWTDWGEWRAAILPSSGPGVVRVYEGKPNHPKGMAGLYQISEQQRSPFRTPPSGQCWDALTTQCWLSAYMQWWEAEGKHGPALRS
jgi:hypothetical protein